MEKEELLTKDFKCSDGGRFAMEGWDVRLKDYYYRCSKCHKQISIHYISTK